MSSLNNPTDRFTVFYYRRGSWHPTTISKVRPAALLDAMAEIIAGRHAVIAPVGFLLSDVAPPATEWPTNRDIEVARSMRLVYQAELDALQQGARP